MTVVYVYLFKRIVHIFLVYCDIIIIIALHCIAFLYLFYILAVYYFYLRANKRFHKH